jgi:superoxide dismutase, Cu-Zn family
MPFCPLAPTACFLISFSAAALAQMPDKVLTAKIIGPDRTGLGMITLTDAPKGVLLRLEASGLPPGWHGMHFHEKGDCSDDKFMNAGAHVHAVTPIVHGFLKEDATDSGDLPNLYVAADGTATVELYSTYVSFKGEGGRPALLDADGSALIIHANPDDYTTQPIGGAGARIACAVIKAG